MSKTTKMFVSGSKTNKMSVRVFIRVCLLREWERKMQNALSFLFSVSRFFFFSLSLSYSLSFSPSVVFFCLVFLSMHLLLCCTRVIGRIFSSIEKTKKNKKKKRRRRRREKEISASNKNIRTSRGNCLSTDTADTSQQHSAKEKSEEEEEEERKVRARRWMSCAHRSAAESRRKKPTNRERNGAIPWHTSKAYRTEWNLANKCALVVVV